MVPEAFAPSRKAPVRRTSPAIERRLAGVVVPKPIFPFAIKVAISPDELPLEAIPSTTSLPVSEAVALAPFHLLPDITTVGTVTVPVVLWTRLKTLQSFGLIL